MNMVFWCFSLAFCVVSSLCGLLVAFCFGGFVGGLLMFCYLFMMFFVLFWPFCVCVLLIFFLMVSWWFSGIFFCDGFGHVLVVLVHCDFCVFAGMFGLLVCAVVSGGVCFKWLGIFLNSFLKKGIAQGRNCGAWVTYPNIPDPLWVCLTKSDLLKAMLVKEQ